MLNIQPNKLLELLRKKRIFPQFFSLPKKKEERKMEWFNLYEKNGSK